VWPAWEVREDDGATAWFQVRVAFSDGARVDALAVVAQGGVSLEDVRAMPALSLDDLGALADWIEGPLLEACGMPPATEHATEHVRELATELATDPEAEAGGPRRARPSWPRGMEGRWLVAQEYRAAQEDGVDPVLAVMCATGHSRRKSLRLISQARDAGFLTPRHARR
jgi:hypothetical protein